MSRYAAILFCLLGAGVIAFQIALAAGMPWGRLAMGGSFGDVLPPPLRIAAGVQAGLFVALCLIVLGRAGLGPWTRLPAWSIWPVVALMAVSLALNLLTPSASERLLWAPVAALLLASSLTVAVLTRTLRPAARTPSDI